MKRSSGCAEPEAGEARGNFELGQICQSRHCGTSFVSGCVQIARAVWDLSNELTRVQSALWRYPWSDASLRGI